MRPLAFLACLLAICLVPCQILARAKVAMPDPTPLTESCVVRAATAANIPLPIMYGILATEGGKVGEAWDNTNGTWDIGPFQVNTCHLNDLAKLGVRPETIMQSGCVNAYAAAWIIKQNLKQTKGDLWEAVGWYHSRTPWRKHAYIKKVKNNMARIERKGLSILPIVRDRYEAMR